MTTTHTSRRDAASFLQSLKHGDAVVVTQDGRDYAMTVSRTYSLSDGKYGDPDGGNVVVTLGPGRWSTTVSAGRVAEGFVAIRRAEEVTPEPAPQVEGHRLARLEQIPSRDKNRLPTTGQWVCECGDKGRVRAPFGGQVDKSLAAHREHAAEAAMHLTGIVTTPGARYPFRAVCSCGWKSWGYVAAHAAQGMLDDHRKQLVQPLMVEPTADEMVPCEECGAPADTPCEWSCTSRPTPPSDAPLNVRATVRKPDGDTFVIFAGQVPTWLWDDDHTRNLWKRERRSHTLRAANVDPKARGYRVTFDAWDPQEADLV